MSAKKRTEMRVARSKDTSGFVSERIQTREIVEYTIKDFMGMSLRTERRVGNWTDIPIVDIDGEGKENES